MDNGQLSNDIQNVDVSNIGMQQCDVLQKRGNLIALTGPSGCGKITLLRLLLKLYPYEGFAAVDKEHIGKIMFLLSKMKENMYGIVVTHDNRVMQNFRLIF